MLTTHAAAPASRRRYRHFKVNMAPACHDPAAPSPALRGTRPPKRVHDAICIGALIYPDNGLHRRCSDSIDTRRPGIAKKLRPTLPLKPVLPNWSNDPHRLSYFQKEDDLRLLNLHWFDHYNDTLERTRRIQVDESRNTIRVISELQNWSDHPQRLSSLQKDDDLRLVNFVWSNHHPDTNTPERSKRIQLDKSRNTIRVISELQNWSNNPHGLVLNFKNRKSVV